MQYLRWIGIAVLLMLTQAANADLFNIQLSNTSGRFLYAHEVYGGRSGPLDLEAGFFYNEDSDKLLHIGMMVRNDTLDNPLVISVGARFYYGDVGHKTGQTHAKFTALAIGGELLFIPNNLGGFGFGVNYYAAPKVVSYMDAESFSEYGARINYEITQQADISLGYRKIRVDLKNQTTLNTDSRLYLGIELRF